MRGLRVDRVPKESWDSEYNILLDGFTRDDKATIDALSEAEMIEDDDIARVDEMLKRVKLVSVADTLRPMGLAGKDRERWLFDNAYRICQCATSSTVKALADEKKKTTEQPLFSVRSKKGENL
ncbi:MAG: hypothetical protein ACKO96_22620, partial [Flammeovirgaceae bacterium]